MTIEQINIDDKNPAKTSGYTVDNEGLINNYAIEPQMYEEDGGATSELENTVTVVDIFVSEMEAKSAVLEMEHKGLRSQQISIVAKDYKESNNSITWESITESGGLAVVLKNFGISDGAIMQFIQAIDDGKFLTIAIGSDREASQAKHVLENIGHTENQS